MKIMKIIGNICWLIGVVLLLILSIVLIVYLVYWCGFWIGTLIFHVKYNFK